MRTPALSTMWGGAWVGSEASDAQAGTAVKSARMKLGRVGKVGSLKLEHV